MQVSFFLFLLINLINFSNSQQIITLKKNNFISIDDKISDENIAKWSKQLSKITSNPIYIYIDSPGGSVNAGLQFINLMNWHISQGKIINCIVKSAYSMGFVILQYCTNRYIIASSTIMQHQMSLYGIGGPINNLMNYLEMIKSISNEVDTKISLRLNITIEEYRNKISNDWWLYGNSAITSNVADEMVIVGCDSELYDVNQIQEELVLDTDMYFYGNSDLNKIKNLCPL